MTRKYVAVFLTICMVLSSAVTTMAEEAVRPTAEPTVEETVQPAPESVTKEAAEPDTEPMTEEEVQPTPESETEKESTANAVYVSGTGDDDNGDGTKDKPYETLAVAVNAADSGDTIYVMSDLTMTSCARFYDKHLKITSGEGGPYTLTRGDGFGILGDNARKEYNPALIEVDGYSPDSASLVLTNIILDDDGKHVGEYFVQADSEGDGKTMIGGENKDNTSIVQDGMIATYNGVGTITLGYGAVLKNYGGMCAVRLSSGELIMEDGSQIIDDREITRVKGTSGSFGPAGAIWLQGGTLTMNGGVIGGADKDAVMNGRAVYVDSGTANIGGTIQNIKGTDAAWQGQDGVGVHVRNNGVANIEGTVTGLTASNISTGKGVYSTGSKIVLNGIVKDCKMMNAVYVSGVRDGKAFEFNGTVSGNTLDGSNGYAIVVENTDAVFGATSVIKDNNSNIATVYAPAGANIDLYGKIVNNTGGQCGGIFMYGNYTAYRDITVDMYDGAEISGNKNTSWLLSRGGAICSGGSTHGPKTIFTMHGGTIKDNTASSGAVLIRKNGTAVMTGGTITENSSYGVRVDGSDKGMPNPFFKMSGGSITDNGSSGISATMTYGTVLDVTDNAVVEGNGGTSQITVSGGDATDAAERAIIGAGTLTGERTVTAAGYNLKLKERYADIGLGQANAAVKTTVTNHLSSNEKYEGWTIVGSALWFKPSESSINFQMGKAYSVKNLGLYAAYIPLNEDGTPEKGAEPVIQRVNNADWIDISLENLDTEKSYGLVLVHNKEYSITADNIVKYKGGGQGDDIYDDGFPALTIVNSVDLKYTGDLTSLEIKGEEIKATEEKTLLDQLVEKLTVTVTNENGDGVGNDKIAGVYKVTLSWNDNLTDKDIIVNDNNVNLDEEGTLIIRYTKNEEGAQNGDITHPLLTSEPTEPVEHAVAIAKKGGWSGTTDPKFYINDDPQRQVNNVEKRRGIIDRIRLLDDDILMKESDDRYAMAREKAADRIGEPAEGKEYKFDFRYLNLVDAYNGNAWVSASNGTTVYLPYPEGVTVDNAEELGVKVVHFEGFDREYGMAGHPRLAEALETAEPELMDVEFNSNGIKFYVGREGFSPFAVVWQENAPVVPDDDGNGGLGGDSDDDSDSTYVTTDRIGGEDRFETAVKVAERLKSRLGVKKFDTIIVVASDDFADALSAAPLAAAKDAPILVVNEHKEKYVKDYIDANLVSNGMVYIIGETEAVPASFEKSLAPHKVTRLGGADRYETNLKVLKELKLPAKTEIMVASGLDYADALTASATGNPILLVKNGIFDYQKEYLKTLGGDDEYFVIGGTEAVNEKTFNQVEDFAGEEVIRVWGDDRFETAKAVADRFFKNARSVYIASGCDFPDSLVGGVIAHKNNAPLLLVSENKYSDAARFVDTHNVTKVTAIGGPAAVSDKVLRAVAS